MFSLDLELTKSCNLNCKYCFESEKKQQYIDFEEVIARIDCAKDRAKALKQNVINIDFTGGEPLLAFNLIKSIVEYCNGTEDYKFQYGIVTNGTLFTDKIASFCGLHDVAINLSLDGNKSSHDKNRINKNGDGSYSVIMGNLKNFIDYPAPVVANMVITMENVKDFYEDFLHIYRLGFKRIRSVLDISHKWNSEELRVLEEQFLQCADYYYMQNKDGQKIYWNFAEDGIERILNPRKEYFCKNGIDSFLADVDGNLHNCSICEEDEFSIIGTVEEGINEEKIKQWRTYKRQLKEKCLDCKMQTFCAQCDCVFLNKKITGDYYCVPEHYCVLTHIQYSLCEKMIDKVRQYKNYRRC
ncbi:radical SAM protein [Lachnotalea glycerini]|uniref:radical SAM protein n=1 Tax=Lachnotalea glycerini TaxID=1763509 RepID=UPI0015F26EFE|nr:radical SAM protein [Lachnotalea glycerini]